MTGQAIIPHTLKFRRTVTSADADLRNDYLSLLTQTVPATEIVERIARVEQRAPLITHDEIQDLLVAFWPREGFGQRYWLCLKGCLQLQDLSAGSADRQRVYYAWEPCFATARQKLVAILQALQVCDVVNPTEPV